MANTSTKKIFILALPQINGTLRKYTKRTNIKETEKKYLSMDILKIIKKLLIQLS